MRTDKILVIDPYTALIPDSIKQVAPNVPQYNWGKNLRIFNTPNRITKKMGENKTLFKYKSAKITLEEITDKQKQIVIKDSGHNRNILKNKKLLNDAILIYSMWEGYYEREKEYWEGLNVDVRKVHSSGHIYVSDLQKFVNALKPKNIIPIHTEHGDKYEELFDFNVIELKDGENAVNSEQ